MLALSTAPAEANDPDRVWTFSGDSGSTPRTAALADHGGLCVTSTGVTAAQAILLSGWDQALPSPLAASSFANWASRSQVAGAARAPVAAVLANVDVDATHSVQTPVLVCYTPWAPSGSWTVDLGVHLDGFDPSTVHVDADGSLVRTAVLDVSGPLIEISAFDASTGQAVSSHAVAPTWYPEALKFSADGSVLASTSDLTVEVWDAASGQPIDNVFLFGFANANVFDLDRDGSTLAMGSLGLVRVLSRGAQGYTQTLELQKPGWVCWSLALDPDGQRLFMGWTDNANPTNTRIEFVDLSTQAAPVLLEEVQGQGQYANRVAAIRLDETGSVLAVGLWGDEADTVDEVRIYRLDEGGPPTTIDLAGSVRDMSLSPDGSLLAVASKDVHASEFGSGGELALFEIEPRDFLARGRQVAGSTIEFEYQGRPGQAMTTLCGSSLAEPPETFDRAGTLYLARGAGLSMLSVVTADDQGVGVIPWQVPDDPGLIGRSFYFQGLSLGRRKLSEQFVTVTVMP